MGAVSHGYYKSVDQQQNEEQPISIYSFISLSYGGHDMSLVLNLAFTFDSVQSAQRAKASLNGADIYSGCCTLKIEYAKVTLMYTNITQCNTVIF